LALDENTTLQYNGVTLPPFHGKYLPPGEWPLTWAQFVNTFGITPHRLRLIDGLLNGLHHLREAGCRIVYIDGGFVTKKKDPPKDIDVCWLREPGIEVWLKRNHPALLNFANERLAQRTIYDCEFFPHDMPADRNKTPFLEYFKRDRNGKPKGIVIMHLKDVP
jgi:hypothetical protein